MHRSGRPATAGPRGRRRIASGSTRPARTGVLRTSGFMRYAQDLAWQHSADLGFGRAWYAERGLTWLVRAAELVVLAAPEMGTTIAARTAIVGIRRVFARRRGEFLLADGTPAGWVHTDWVLIDARGAPDPRSRRSFRRCSAAREADGPGRPDPVAAHAVRSRPSPVRRSAPRARSDGSREQRRLSRLARGERSSPPPIRRRRGPRRSEPAAALPDGVRARRRGGRRARRRGVARTTTAGATGSPAATADADRFRARVAPARRPRSDHRRRTHDQDGAHGGRVFDGTGSDPAARDVAVEDGRIVGLGTGLDGDDAVDVTRPDDPARAVRLPRPRLLSTSTCGVTPSSRSRCQFFEAAENLREDARDRDHLGPRCRRRGSRDQGGASSDGTDRRSADADLDHRCSARPVATATTGTRRAAPRPVFVAHPGRPSAIVDGPDEVRRKVRELAARAPT